MEWDSVLNVIFFIVGLAIGLFQLYWGQHQFELQQREKMDEIRQAISDIRERLTVVQEVSSQRVFDVQDRLITLATREEVVSEATEGASDEMRALITDELNRAGVPDAVGRTSALEGKVAQILEASAKSVIDQIEPRTATLTQVEKTVFDLALQGYKNLAIASRLAISDSAVSKVLTGLYRKLQVHSKDEMIAKFSEQGGHKINVPPSIENQ